MRLPQMVVYEKDGRLKLQLAALAEERRWALREARQPEACLAYLSSGGPAVVVIKADSNPEREMALLERVTWLHPYAAAVLVGDGDQTHLGGLAWDLGAAYVLFPPQPRERLAEIVAGLMGDNTEEKKT